MGCGQFRRYEVCQLGDFVLSREDFAVVVVSGPAGSGKTSVLLDLGKYLEWAEESGAVRRALFAYCDMGSFPGSCRSENRALEALKKVAGVASGAAEALGGIARALKAGDALGAIGAVKGGARAVASILSVPREREPLSAQYYVEVVASGVESRVKALKPEYAVVVFDNVGDEDVVAVAKAAVKIASGAYKYGARAAAFVATTPLGMKKAMLSSALDGERVYYAVVENPTREEFSSLFYDLGGHKIAKYGYTADELYGITSGNPKAAKHVIEHADGKSLCNALCLRRFIEEFGVGRALLRLKSMGLFGELLAYASRGGPLSSAAIDQFMKYGLVYYKPRALADYGLLALPYKYSHRGEYVWSSRLARLAVAEAAAIEAKNAHKVHATTAI